MTKNLENIGQDEGDMPRNETHANAIFAEFYPELSPKFLDYERARAAFRKIVETRERCLEIGIGSGVFALELIKEGYQIDGLEQPNSLMLDALKKSLKDTSGYKPNLIEKKAQEYDFDDEYDVIFSHSGPFFFVRGDGDKLYFEGLRDDQLNGEEPISFHKELIMKIVQSLKKKEGRMMVNIQEDRTDIPLKDGSVLFQYDRVGEYDLDAMSVVKYGRFVNQQTGALMQPEDPKSRFEPYRRFACSFEQFAETCGKVADVSIEIRDGIWVLLRPNSAL
jgi:hypothetical protein